MSKLAEYLAKRISDGALAYDDVIAKFPALKSDIDSLLGNA